MDFSRRRNARLEGSSSTLIEVSARDVSQTIFCEPADEAERSPHLQEAFDAYGTHAVGEARWMTLEEIREFQALPQNQRSSVHYVCDPFEGSVFDLVRGSSNPVFGPLVLLRCLRDKRTLPVSMKAQPIYSQAMKDVVATFSSVVPTRRRILTQRLEWMGGRTEAALNNTVTHVITDEVGSKKYIVGAQRGLAVQTTLWIDHVWDVTQRELKHAISVAEEFKTPIFANLTVTTSGLAEEEKAEIMKLVQENGGTYTGKLTKANTHLVIREAKGAKYAAALKWQLHVVSPEWVFNCMKKGFMVDPVQYRMGELVDSSPGNNTLINTSVTSVASTVSRSVLSERTMNVAGRGDPAYSEVLRLSKEDVSVAGQFLDGCSVHVFGVRDKALLDRLHQIINQAGGLREDSFNDGVTHIITIPSASGLSELHRHIEASFASPAVLLPSWLVACVRQKSLAPPGPYAVPGFDPPAEAAEGGDDANLTNSVQTTCQSNSMYSDRTCNVSVSSTRSKSSTLNKVCGGGTVGCLTGKLFFLTQELRVVFLNVVHDLSTLREGIESLGGRLVDSQEPAEGSDGQQLFTVYTNMVSAATPGPNAITILHLENVIRQRRWIEPSTSPFFQVFHAPKSDVPNGAMGEVVVTPTGFDEQEVTSMSRVLAMFGASLQAVMVKNSKPDKKLWGTTHLVCATARSNGKFDAAKKWKIPAVTMDWVLACAREGRRIGVKEYLVDPEQWETLPDAVKRSPRKPPPETPIEKRKRPIQLQVTPSETTQNRITDIVTMPASDSTTTPKASADKSGVAFAERNTSEIRTPVLSSQRMRELYEEASRFKTPKNADLDSPGMPRITADKVSEMMRQIQDSPLQIYDIPEASFDEKCSQAMSVKSRLAVGQPLAGVVAMLDEGGLQPSVLELKLSIERLGGWVSHTVERCTIVVLPPSHAQSDDARRLRISAQRLNKPLVGVEWIWATIDRMKKPPLEEFPPDYEKTHGAPYIRTKMLKDYIPKWDDSDLDISLSKTSDVAKNKITNDKSSVEPCGVEAEHVTKIVDPPSIENLLEPSAQTTNVEAPNGDEGGDVEPAAKNDLEQTLEKRSLRPRRSSAAPAGSETSLTPLAAGTRETDQVNPAPLASVPKDPLRDLLSRRSSTRSNTPTRRVNRTNFDDASRSQHKRSQPILGGQYSSGSVLADIETQPEEEISYGGPMVIPTSTQLNSTVCGDPVNPNFGDVSMVRPCVNDPMRPPPQSKAILKRSRDLLEDDNVVGKRFKKNRLALDVSADDEPEPSQLPLSNESPEKVYELYYIDEETNNRCRQLIAELGGNIVDEHSTDAVTQAGVEKIIIVDPTQQRILKKSSLLQQLACGGWVVAPRYIDDCATAGEFLPESDYMIGVGVKGQPEASSQKWLAERFACWHRWRKLRLERGTGAFDGWKVALFSSTSERERGHRRLLIAGGAIVLDKEDEDALKQATHVFVTKGDTRTAKQLRTKLGPDILILAPEYMLHYLSLGEMDPNQFAIK
ncbi:DNA topoisomerase 2-binding protein 1-B-like [Tropilaelaps mercedesae]|uniref:DNA topoisomerase 2-binding protein 1-B-like n=1 Tax=Tropilaelaps mercedesae TaxID=418985 RepID=A0A1V9X3P4_9ACAR|nr:DNA topoisomerase 2-binding protein 1-B-like [Tropilaelaps mercedesae]